MYPKKTERNTELMRDWREGTTLNLTLNSPKFSSPGSWKDPQLPNWIPERKKFRVKVAAMEQKSWGSKKEKEELSIHKIKTGTVSCSLRLMPAEWNLKAFSSFRKIVLLRFKAHSLLQKRAGVTWTTTVIWFGFPHKKFGISPSNSCSKSSFSFFFFLQRC